jgi:hypothetical protein
VISSNASQIAAELRAFSVTRSIVEWIDGTAPAVIAALKTEAPYGPERGEPHLRDRIFVERHSAIGLVQATYETDRSPVAKFVLGGTKPHDIPGAFGYPPPFGIGGRFEGKFHPGTAPNPFNVRAWLEVEDPVADSLVEKLVRALV